MDDIDLSNPFALLKLFAAPKISSNSKPKIAVMYSWLKDYTKFDMKIETLDSKNVVIGVMTLKDCHFNRIDFGSLGYSLASDVYNYTITVTPKSINVV